MIEERQVEDGPCHDAYRSGDVVTSADLPSEERWTDYIPVTLEQGFRSVAGIP